MIRGLHSSLKRRWLVAALALAGIGFAARPARSSVGACESLGELAAGIRLESVDLGGASEGQAWGAVQILARHWLDTPVTLVVGGTLVQRTRRELGATVDVEGSCLALAEPSGARDVSLVRGVDADALEAALTALAAELDRSPVLASIDPRTETWSPPREGRLVQVRPAAAAVTEALTTGAVVVEVPVRVLPVPERSIVRLAEATFTHVIARYTTSFPLGEDQWGRVRNIAASADAIDGAIVGPGEVVSFNALVGERTVERGFRPADEVVSGRVVEGIGGGVCQTAATLHAAAFLGGLEIVEHHPHARGSSYIELGLDAAVSWPSLDLRVRNPYFFPIRIRAQVSRGTLEISLLGAADVPEVSWRTEIVERTPHGVEILPPGSDEEEDPGVDGYRVMRERVMRAGDHLTRERVELRYAPVSARTRGTE